MFKKHIILIILYFKKLEDFFHPPTLLLYRVSCNYFLEISIGILQNLKDGNPYYFNIKY